MTTKKEAAKQYHLLENGGDYVMMSTKGSAFLYPGAKCVVSDMSQSDIERLVSMGAKFTEITEDQATQMIDNSGILGVK